MTHISELVDVDTMVKLVEDGYIRTQSYDGPESVLTIYNYAEKTVFEGAWTPETRIARGLILDADGNVLARPFSKFFNFHESHAPELHGTMRVIATDKMDGSLGIGYLVPGGEYRIATRGSFMSDQAVHATRLLHTKYPEWAEYSATWFKSGQVTPLFEIVYPENRIVCDYGTVDDLILLGWIHIRSGAYFEPDKGYWPGPRTEILPYKTVAEAVASEDREGKEGMVLYVPEVDDWVKLKQSDYIELHRLVTGLSARRVYEALGSGQTVENICAPLPDEFHQFVRDVSENVFLRMGELLLTALSSFDLIETSLDADGIGKTDPTYRREFARYAKEYADYPSMMFGMLDGKDINPAIWKLIEPSGDWTLGTHHMYREDS